MTKSEHFKCSLFFELNKLNYAGEQRHETSHSRY